MSAYPQEGQNAAPSGVGRLQDGQVTVVGSFLGARPTAAVTTVVRGLQATQLDGRTERPIPPLIASPVAWPRVRDAFAHEIRNPVANIRNCLELVRRRVAADPEAREFTDLAEQDESDVLSFYQTLENEVVPLFYDRGKDGIPHRWLERVKDAIASLTPTYSTHRMVQDYGKRVFRALKLRDYARLDFRLTDDGRLVFIEANPNSDLTPNTLGRNLCFVGIEYRNLIPRIVETARKRYRGR